MFFNFWTTTSNIDSLRVQFAVECETVNQRHPSARFVVFIVPIQTVTIRTIPDFRHPRTGGTALLLSTTTELLVIDLIAQHDPQPDSQLAGHGHTCFPQPLLHQFAPITVQVAEQG